MDRSIGFGDMNTVDICTLQKIDTIGHTVQFVEYHSFYAWLDDKLGTLKAWRGRDIERGSVARVISAGHFRNRVCFGMKDLGLCQSGLVLANVFEPRGSAVISVGYYHLVLDYYSADFPAFTVWVFGPDCSHPQISFVECFLLFLRLCHLRMNVNTLLSDKYTIFFASGITVCD